MESSVRTFVPVPPHERPLRRRRTARVLLIDDRDRLLLFADRDPGLPGSGWWMTPGGGVDPGETDLDAAVRELEEETGLQVDADAMLGPVLIRPVVHGYTDVVIDQEDAFFACWVPSFDVSHDGHTPEERLTMSTHHWWSRDELAASDEVIWPVDLLALWADAELRRTAAVRGESPTPPTVGAAVEESTVPA